MTKNFNLIPDRHELELLDLSDNPSEWPRVKVVSPLGKASYKFIPDIMEEDIIPVRSDGLPHMMFKKPGRPLEMNSVDEDEESPPEEIPKPSRRLLEQRLREKQELIANDPMVQLLQGNADSASILQMALIALAEEQAALRVDRITAEKEGESGTPYSVRRISSLEKLVNNWIKRKDMYESTSVDLDSKAFGIILGFIVETFHESLMETGVKDEMIEPILNGLARRIGDDNWKIEARSRMRAENK